MQLHLNLYLIALYLTDIEATPESHQTAGASGALWSQVAVRMSWKILGRRGSTVSKFSFTAYICVCVCECIYPGVVSVSCV